MLLRQAKRADAAQIARVGADAWASFIYQHATEKPDQRRRVELAFLRFAEDNPTSIILAEQDNTICGWGARDGNINYISDLWIKPDMQGQGIGSALMDALLAQIVLLGFTSAEIGTHAKNSAAIRLYEKCGFVITDRFTERSNSLGEIVEKVKMQASL